MLSVRATASSGTCLARPAGRSHPRGPAPTTARAPPAPWRHQFWLARRVLRKRWKSNRKRARPRPVAARFSPMRGKPPAPVCRGPRPADVGHRTDHRLRARVACHGVGGVPSAASRPASTGTDQESVRMQVGKRAVLQSRFVHTLQVLSRARFLPWRPTSGLTSQPRRAA